MKQTALRSFVAAGLLALVLATPARAETPATVRITTGEWPPYTSESERFYGVASRLVSEAFAESGIVVEFGFFPWTRAMKLARDGDWDGTSIWFDTEERRQAFYYSEPVIMATNSFFFLKGSAFDWNDFADLAELRVGGTREYSYGKEFDAAEAAGVFETHRSITDEAGLENLLKGRIDVFPGEQSVVYAVIEKTFNPEDADRITHHPRPISTQPLYLLLSKGVADSERLLILFNRGLQQLKENGRYDQIVEEAVGGARGFLVEDQ
jgi:polar amino acid transport system substrate-binding protein